MQSNMHKYLGFRGLPKHKAQQTVKSAGLLLVVLCITLRMLLAACIDSASLIGIGRREFAVSGV